MSWRRTGVLWAITAVFFAFIIFVERPIRMERSRPPDRHVLPGLNPAALTNIEIQPWDRPAIAAERSAANQPWHLRRPISYPADSQRIDALLNELAALQWQERINEQELKGRPNALDNFGLTKPRCSILLQGAGGSRRLDVGEQTAFGDQVFSSVVGNPAVFLTSSNMLGLIPIDKTLWRSTTLLDFGAFSFDSLSAKTGGEEIDLKRDPTNHLWLMSKPQPARADTAKVNALLAQLQRLSVLGFASDEGGDGDSYGFQPGHPTELDLTFFSGSNTEADLQIGGPVGGHPKLAYARRAYPSNIVVVARGPFLQWEESYTNFLDQHFISLPPELITSIDVTAMDHFRAERQTNGQWLIRGKDTFTADPVLIDDWLSSLTNINTQIKKTVAADLPEYGLARPLMSFALELPPNAGSQSNILLQFGTNRAGQIFERRTDEDFVNTISPEDFSRLPKVSWQLRDRQIWNFDPTNVTSVTIYQHGGERGYLRDPLGQWTFAPGSYGPPFINATELNETIFRLSHLRAIFWDGVGNYRGDPFGFAHTDHRFELHLQRGSATEMLTLEFGARSPYFHPYAAVVKDGERLIFEFPADLYENFVRYDLSVPKALWRRD